MGKSLVTTESMRSLFAEEGYKLIGEYINSRTPMKYVCPKGHIGKAYSYHWTTGRRCPKCDFLKNTHVHDLEYVEEYFKKYGCELLDEYENSRQILRFQCSCGNVGKVSFNHYLRKPDSAKLCSKCNVQKISETELETIFEQHGCIYIGRDSSTRGHYLGICECGNNFRVRLDLLKKGRRCQSCKQYRKPSGFHKPKRLIQDAEAV